MRKAWLKTSLFVGVAVLAVGSGPPAMRPAWQAPEREPHNTHTHAGPVVAQPAAPQPTTTAAIQTRSTVAEVDELLETADFTAAETRLTTALRSTPDDAALHDRYVAVALQRDQYSTALERIDRARTATGDRPVLHYRSAQAYYGLGRLLGRSAVRRVPGGRVGQFHDDLLLAQAQDDDGRFLCCPAQSALYQIRLALDGGFSEPEAHVLHARIWLRLGRPALAARILDCRAAVLLKEQDPAVLALFADVALAQGDLRYYLRYKHRQAACATAEHDEVLASAFANAARHASERGEPALHLHWLRRAVDLRPEDAPLRRQLGDALWDAGDTDAAADHYRAVLAKVTDIAERRQLLDRILTAAQPD